MVLPCGRSGFRNQMILLFNVGLDYLCTRIDSWSMRRIQKCACMSVDVAADAGP